MVEKMASLKERTIRPMKTLDANRIAYKFHERCGAPQIWENHIREVKAKATQTTIVEPDIIDSPQSDIYQAWVNSVLNDILNYHDVKHEVVGTIKDNLRVRTPALRDERIIQEIEVFGELTELDRKGADLAEYVPLLNNGDAPLALLARILDYAVTHNDGKYLKDFISPNGHPILRMFRSYEEAQETLRNEAKAGEMIYAPLAELFGHPGLAGDILAHSFKVRYLEVHNYVMESLGNETINEKLDFTRDNVRKLLGSIEKELHNMGFEFEVQERMEKNKGKKMRKVRKMLAKEYGKSEESNVLSLKQYITNHIDAFDITTLNDLVAGRIILDTYQGREIDRMEEDEKHHVRNAAIGLIKKHLDAFIAVSDYGYAYTHECFDKPNGYKGDHFDVRPIKRTTIQKSTRFELQMRTKEEHEVSEHGKAAHYYYVLKHEYKEGSRLREEERKFVDEINTTYSDMIYLLRRKSNS